MKKILLLMFCLLPVLSAAEQDVLTVVRVNEQRTFPDRIPAGNYSGIVYLGDSLYAVVSDKSANDGFFVFKITLDSLTGNVLDVENLGFRGDTDTDGDVEAVAYVPETRMLYIARETDNIVRAYSLEGQRMDRTIAMPECYGRATHNYGLESLSYNAATRMFWTCNESTLQGDGQQADAVNGVRNRLRLQSFDADFRPLHQYAYLMDKPESTRKAYLYGMGVGEVLALSDGSLLVMEREFYTPPAKLGAYVSNKIYRVVPSAAVPVEHVDRLDAHSPYMNKQLVAAWRTTLTLFRHEIANYEGMCLGPKLNDGSQVIVLVSDSQNQAGGVMKDWFKTIVVR